MPLEYPNACPAVPCARLVAAVRTHRNAHWQVGHGFLGLPKPERDGETAKPASGPNGSVWGRRGSSKPQMRRWARQVRIETARSVGAGRRARGTGWECSGKAACVRHAARAWRRAQCSPPRVAAFDTAVRWAWHGNQAASTSLVVHLTAVVTVHEGASRATSTLNRRVSASLSGLALQCGCCWLLSHAHQRRRAAGECTSVAMAFASACG